MNLKRISSLTRDVFAAIRGLTCSKVHNKQGVIPAAPIEDSLIPTTVLKYLLTGGFYRTCLKQDSCLSQAQGTHRTALIYKMEAGLTYPEAVTSITLT